LRSVYEKSTTRVIRQQGSRTAKLRGHKASTGSDIWILANMQTKKDQHFINDARYYIILPKPTSEYTHSNG